MEEILSSIKRIIAEEGDAAVGARARRAPRAAASPSVDEILELSEPVPEPAPQPAPPVAAPQPAAKEPAARPAPQPLPDVAETIVSASAVEATRGPLEALSRMVVRPEAPTPAAETLEGLVRELLRPMLREWLDANLPQMVEEMVAREIARITSNQ